MAIVSMKKLVLVGYGKDKNKILKSLHKTGCVEISKTSDLDNTYRKEDTLYKDEVTTKLNRLSFVFSFLKAEKRTADILVKADKFSYEAEKKSLFTPTPRFEFDEFNKITEAEDEIFAEVKELENANQRYIDIKSEIIKLESLIEQVKVFTPIACKLNAFHDTRFTAITLGAVPVSRVPLIESIKADYPMLYIEVSEGSKLAPVVIISLKEEKEAILARFNEIDFIKSSFVYDMTASEKVEEALKRIEELEAEKLLILAKSIEKMAWLPKFKHIFDYYTIENAKLQASDGFALTKSTFVLEGWFPASEEERVRTELSGISDALIIETRDAIEGEIIPTYTVNNKIVAPYESVTNMYSVPSVNDIDPNPFVAFFYFVMFGMMMGDAVYGIVLSVLGFTAYRLMKPVPGKGKIVLIIAMGGISTFIWGALFGGWMALPIPENSFLDKITWFKPLDPDGAIKMLILSFAMGFIQIVFGMGLKAYDLIRKGHWFDAVCDIFSWYIIFIGLFMYAAASKAPSIKTPGLVLMLVGVGILIVFGGRDKKGFGRVIGGLGQLYNSVNFLSDILSYSRLFGLGLATGVIGMVINKISGVIISILPTFGGVPVLGVIFAAPIFIVGHVFNIGINTLGTYVHDSRLHFIEFFSKFYEGGGHQFVPLGSNTKYTYIEK